MAVMIEERVNTSTLLDRIGPVLDLSNVRMKLADPEEGRDTLTTNLTSRKPSTASS
jgi:hypothetical protein